MNNIKRIIAALLAGGILVTATACGAPQGSEVPAESTETVSPAQGPASADLCFTHEQMLEDFDALWATLQENYPFFGVLERLYVSKGLHAGYYDTSREAFRQKILELPEDRPNAAPFMLLVNDFLRDIGGSVGHLGLFPPEMYTEGLDVYRTLSAEMPEFAPWVEVIDEERTAELYAAYIPALQEYMQEQQQQTAGDSAQAPAQPPTNLETGISEDGEVAFLTIRSFGEPHRAGDVPRILDFYNEITGCEHLVIDITENSGGNVMYWMEALVAPNITETVTLSNKFLMKDGPIAQQFFGSEYDNSPYSTAEIRSDPAYINLHAEDLDTPLLVRSADLTIEPVGDVKAFDGKIWLLTSPFVYSASERLADFCKRTGFATLVGETTGGDGVGSDPVIYALPNSHFLIRFNVEYGLNADGSCNQEIGTAPDIPSQSPLATCLERIQRS